MLTPPSTDDEKYDTMFITEFLPRGIDTEKKLQKIVQTLLKQCLGKYTRKDTIN